MANVKVKLHARCLVDHQIREAGEIVELPDLADDGLPFAAVFGQIVGKVDEEPAESSTKPIPIPKGT